MCIHILFGILVSDKNVVVFPSVGEDSLGVGKEPRSMVDLNPSRVGNRNPKQSIEITGSVRQTRCRSVKHSIFASNLRSIGATC